MKPITYFCIAVLAALIAVALTNGGGCAGLGKATIAPADQRIVDSVVPVSTTVADTGASIKKLASDGATNARGAAVNTDGAKTNVGTALATPGLPIAAKQPLVNAGKQLDAATGQVLIAEKDFAAITAKAADLDVLQPKFADLQSQVQQLAQEKADEVAARKKAEAETEAANGVISTHLRQAAEACGILGALLIAGMIWLPVTMKPNLFEVGACFGAAAGLTALSVAWAQFVSEVHAHPVITVGIIVAVVGIVVIVVGRYKGWFDKAVGFAESTQTLAVSKVPALAADFKVLSAKAATESGPVFAGALRLAKKDWVKVTAWKNHLLHKDVKTTAAAHVDAVAAVAAALPVAIPTVPANPTPAAPVPPTTATPLTVTTITTP